MTTYVSKSSVKGQIVIPAKLRQKYGIQDGTTVQFIDTGEQIILQPLTEAYFLHLQGSLGGKRALAALVEDRAAERDR